MTAAEAVSDRAGRHAWLVAAAAVLLAAAFQIQETPRLGGGPVRVSLADLASPFLLLALGLTMKGQTWRWPRWSLTGLWIWLGILSGLVALSLVVGRWHSGVWLPWAVVNKFAGWFALVWYLLVGGIVAATLGRPGIERFFKAFLIVLWIGCAASVVGLVLFQADLVPSSWMRFNRAEGFMKNPNAFGVLIAIGMAIALPHARSAALFRPRWHLIGLVLALTALVLTGSRTAWLAALMALAWLGAVRAVPWRIFGLAALGATVLLAVLLFVLPAFMEARPESYQSIPGGYVLNEPMFSSADRGLTYRYETAMVALGLWWREPFLGTGLGGFPFSLVKAGRPAEVIHSTYLWILTEMGVVGFVAFAGFFVVVLRAVWRRVQNERDPRIPVAAMGMLCAVAGAALGMEAMYQRHLWFILGLALAVPVPAGGPVAAAAGRG